jgi:hypothetical protein
MDESDHGAVDELIARLQVTGRLGEYELTHEELRMMRALRQSGVVHSGLFRKTRRNDPKRPDEYISLHPYYFLKSDTRDMDSLVFADGRNR